MTHRLLSTAAIAAFLLGTPSPSAHARGLDTGWLTRPAEKAILGNELAKAALLYSGAVALDRAVPQLHWRLARIYTMAGQRTLAQQAYTGFLKVSKDPQKRARAQAKSAQLAKGLTPFATTDLSQQRPLRSYALRAAGKARTHLRRGAVRKAIRYYETALVLDSSLVGVFRLLGAAYARLKDKKRARQFFLRYLRIRPAGPLAARVRKRLKGDKGLARVTFKASFPCAVYINRLPLSARKKTPIRSVLLSPGTYTIILHHGKYHAARKIRLTVAAAERKTVRFDFGVLVVRLKPWARVRANGRDVGLWTEIGLPAGRAKLDFKTDDGLRRMTRRVVVKGRKRIVIRRWK